MRYSLCRRRALAAVALGLVAAGLMAGHARAASVTSDFNGDGYADLAVGVPGEDLAGRADVGAVVVLFGSGSGGLSARGSLFISAQRWHGSLASGSRFGAALATGDFDGDGHADLAIGAPGAAGDAGRLYVIYGGPAGFGRTAGPFAQSYVKGTAERGDMFAAALATGDFNGDGRADLAIGVPGEDVRTTSDAGEVDVAYGSPKGLRRRGDAWHQDVPGVDDSAEPGDRFGAALAAADFGRGRPDDLAIGVPGEDLPGATNAGAVAVLYGAQGRGLSPRNDQLWTQDFPGVLDEAEDGDAFGSALAAGDFGGSSVADLAIGIPGEDLGTLRDAGAVAVFYGDPSAGLGTPGNELWSQGAPGVDDSAEAGDRFGAALAAGQLDTDGHADLAVGVPGEDLGPIADAGAVAVLYGSPSGVAADRSQLWTQDVPNVLDQAEAGDDFGTALAIGLFGGQAQPGLVVGVPGEDRSAQDGGAVNVIYGGAAGVTTAGNQLWDEGLLGVDPAESGDAFGAALAAGP